MGEDKPKKLRRIKRQVTIGGTSQSAFVGGSMSSVINEHKDKTPDKKSPNSGDDKNQDTP